MFAALLPSRLLACLLASITLLKVRLAVDLVAGTHILSRDWILAEGLYVAWL